MKNISLALFIVFSICFAQKMPEKPYSNYDSLEMVISDLDKSQKEMKKSIDSLLNNKFISDKSIMQEVLEKSQEFYSNSFNNILVVLGIFVTFLLAPGIWNWFFVIKYNRKIKNELEETKKELSEILEKNKKENIQNTFHIVNRKMAEVYVILAGIELNKDNWNMHFVCLGNFYLYLNQMDKLGDNEFTYLEKQWEYIFKPNYKKYKDNINIMHASCGKFFYRFLLFIEYIKNINKNTFYIEREKYNELIEMFDYEKVKKSIENFFKEAQIKETERKHILDLAEHYRLKSS